MSTWGVLGQTSDASSEVTLYEVPPLKIVKYYISITNRSTAATFRLAHVPGGGATANEDYFAYDEDLPANRSLTSEIRTGTATDIIRVTTSTANITVHIYGVEADQ